MSQTILFGNGLNRAAPGAISWSELLDSVKGARQFNNSSLPNTMIYERIYLDRKQAKDELRIIQDIAKALEGQAANELYKDLIDLKFENYLTTNYDYAFEKAISLPPKLAGTEEVYSLRRYRSYSTEEFHTKLWSIHGEIDHPKSIMLGLDHYCGSISKLDAYIKGSYSTQREGKPVSVRPMKTKLNDQNFCHTAWVDLFFSGDVHIIGLSLDFSETDLWWVLNKRARLKLEQLINNHIYFHTDSIEEQKLGLLKSFDVAVVRHSVPQGDDYLKMYKTIMSEISGLSAPAMQVQHRATSSGRSLGHSLTVS